MFVPGVPIPQPRPRITVRGRHGVAYVPKDHPIHEWRAKVREWMEKSVSPGQAFPVSGVGLRVVMAFYLPKVVSNRNPSPIGRPDLDNLAKAVLDAGNGVIWRDDSLVTTLVIRKRWDAHPGLSLAVGEDI